MSELPPEELVREAMLSGRRQSHDPAEIAEIAGLVVRLAGLMRREAVMSWLRTPLPGLDGRSPLELLADGEWERVTRVVSKLEDQSAAQRDSREASGATGHVDAAVGKVEHNPELTD